MSRLLDVINEDIITGDDGYRVFWPEGMNGALSAQDMREIAEYLDIMNADWDTQLNEFFEREQNDRSENSNGTGVEGHESTLAKD